jgi:hypothetical protein
MHVYRRSTLVGGCSTVEIRWPWLCGKAGRRCGCVSWYLASFYGAGYIVNSVFTVGDDAVGACSVTRQDGGNGHRRSRGSPQRVYFGSEAHGLAPQSEEREYSCTLWHCGLIMIEGL